MFQEEVLTLTLHYNWKTTRRAIALILCAMLTALNLCASAESVVATRKAKAYGSPSTGAASITVPAGTVMELTAEGNGWVRVERKGITAYMRAVDVEAIASCDSVTVYAERAVPLYKSYGKSARYGTIPAGAELTAYVYADSWAYVDYRGCRGFVAKSALTLKKPEAADTQTAYATVYVANSGAKAYSKAGKVLGTLPLNTSLSLVRVSGSWALVASSGKYAVMRVSDLSSNPVSEAEKSEEKAEEQPTSKGIQAMDWWTSDIQTIFARGVKATITDVATGISWREVRKGGAYHADCQPLTAEDTANMKKACGGKWSWDRRAVVVTINGQHYAASINCMPHGGGSVTGNNFDGHHCIHFINSRTSGTNKVDADHQAAIKKALALNK